MDITLLTSSYSMAVNSYYTTFEAITGDGCNRLWKEKCTILGKCHLGISSIFGALQRDTLWIINKQNVCLFSPVTEM